MISKNQDGSKKRLRSNCFAPSHNMFSIQTLRYSHYHLRKKLVIFHESQKGIHVILMGVHVKCFFKMTDGTYILFVNAKGLFCPLQLCAQPPLLTEMTFLSKRRRNKELSRS